MALRKLVFATGNPHKVREVAAMLDGQFAIQGLAELGVPTELPETRRTIAGNARQKAEYIFEKLNIDCFAEDTGLEIDALGGAPGVDTAHYAGPQRDPRANMRKVLAEMAGTEDRSARFRTVIALVLGGQTHTFEGVAEGHITHAPRGTGGFGYDPIFQPEGSDHTFAELPPSSKNQSSHRARAFRKLLQFLETHPPSQS